MGKHRFREKTSDIIKERSTKNSSFWYVEFDNGRSVFCSQNILMFHSNVPQKVHLGSDKDNQLCLNMKDFVSKDTDPLSDGQDKIKTEILLSKIYKLPSHDSFMYEKLAQIDKYKYPWINAWKLRSHISKMQKKLMQQASPDSWIFNLTKTSGTEDVNASSKSSKCVTENKCNIENNIANIQATNLAFDSKNVMNTNDNRSLAKKFLSESIKIHCRLNEQLYPYTTYKSLRGNDDKASNVDEGKSGEYYFLNIN